MCPDEAPTGAAACCAAKSNKVSVAASRSAFCNEATTDVPSSHATMQKGTISWRALAHIIIAR
jgi:hypothetical protein